MHRKRNTFIVIIVIVCVIAGIIGITQEQTPLPAYIETNTPAPTSTPEPETVELQPFVDEISGFTMKVPVGWTRVTQDGFPTFIHAPSSSSIQIQIVDYYPQINIATAETMQAALSLENKLLINFYWVDNSSYICMYQGTNTSSEYIDYIDLVYFDRSYVITVKYILPDQYYKKLEQAVLATLDSVSWSRPDPIPDNMTLYYSEFGNFEFGTPIGWSSAIQNGVYYASQTETGAILTVTAAESPITYENVTQLDYVQIASAGKEGFTLTSYSADSSLIYGTGSYWYENQQYIFVQYLMASGVYEYSLTFECPAATYESIRSLVGESVKCFRLFY